MVRKAAAAGVVKLTVEGEAEGLQLIGASSCGCSAGSWWRCASAAWNPLHARFAMQRINHQHGCSLDGACTNGAESCFSRLHRAELGHHHIAGPYLIRYAQEAAWREDLRRVGNGARAHGAVGLAMRSLPSVGFCGYWQRAQAA